MIVGRFAMARAFQARAIRAVAALAALLLLPGAPLSSAHPARTLQLGARLSF